MKNLDKYISDLRMYGFCTIKRMFDKNTNKSMDSLASDLSGSFGSYYESSVLDLNSEILMRVEKFIDNQQTRDLLLSVDLLKVIEGFFNEPCILFKDKINYKLPGAREDTVHQDQQAGWGNYANTFLSVMIAIDKNTEENACLWMPNRKNYKHSKKLLGEMFKTLTPKEVKNIDFTPMYLDPGDVIVFDSYVPHYSHSNTSNLKRRNIFLTFNKLSEGDKREQYYIDKYKSYPPNSVRNSDKEYKYLV